MRRDHAGPFLTINVVHVHACMRALTELVLPLVNEEG